MLEILLFSCIGVFIGGSALYGLTRIKYWHFLFEADDLLSFIQVFVYIFGGSVFYGGLLGGMAVAAFVMKKRGYPSDLMTDCAAPAVALFHGFGRIGCFLGGCCYGKEVPWGVTFRNSLNESANGVPRIPVQLFEAGFEFLMFFVLWQLLRRGRFEGRLFALYLAVYGVFRFCIEFLRGDDYRGFILGLSTSQFISVFTVIGALLYIAVRTSRRRIPYHGD